MFRRGTGAREKSLKCGGSAKARAWRSVRCGPHPKGGEARVTVDGEWQRGEAGAAGLALVDLALQWKNAIPRQGMGVMNDTPTSEPRSSVHELRGVR